jgi:hypothetical protein
MQGERSGGGYVQPTGGGSDDDGAGFRGGGGRGRDPASTPVRIDLKKYLPGGAMDPNRRLGGLGTGKEIIGRFEDMWKHVSNRYIEKCRLGVLKDCG